MRSKHKEYYETKKEEHGTFKPVEGTEFTFEDVDLDKMKEESEVTVPQPRAKVRKSNRAVSSQTSGESDVSDYKSKRSRKKLIRKACTVGKKLELIRKACTVGKKLENPEDIGGKRQKKSNAKEEASSSEASEFQKPLPVVKEEVKKEPFVYKRDRIENSTFTAYVN